MSLKIRCLTNLTTKCFFNFKTLLHFLQLIGGIPTEFPIPGQCKTLYTKKNVRGGLVMCGSNHLFYKGMYSWRQRYPKEPK